MVTVLRKISVRLQRCLPAEGFLSALRACSGALHDPGET